MKFFASTLLILFICAMSVGQGAYDETAVTKTAVSLAQPSDIPFLVFHLSSSVGAWVKLVCFVILGLIWHKEIGQLLVAMGLHIRPKKE